MSAVRSLRSTGARWASLCAGGAFLVLLALQLSIWPVFEFQRYMIRSEMKEKLLRCVPKEDLLVFRFTADQYAELDFEDGGREVELNGSMHDIVRTAVDADGSIFVQVVRDDAETALLSSLDRQVRGLQQADTRGRDQRRVLVSMWPVFHECLLTADLPRSGSERYFVEVRDQYRHLDDPADHGPPREA